MTAVVSLPALPTQDATGCWLSYQLPDVRPIMDKLQIPEKGVDDIMLKHPNGWPAETKRYGIICTTVGDIYAGHRDAEGVFLITHIKIIRHG